MSSFYTEDELRDLGFRSVGEGVKISRRVSVYSAQTISIGDNVRIDDFCILSGNITIGSHIHISAYCALYGSQGIVLEDYTGISPRSTLFSAMDDFGGDYLIGPVHDSSTTNVTEGKVILRRYSQIGAHSVVFPGVELGEGSVLGACSMARESTAAWTIYAGVPARAIRGRDRGLLELIK